MSDTINPNIITYTPPPTVERFIRDYIPSKMFYDWILGPVGSGKTTGIMFKLAYMAKQQAPSPLDGVRRSRAVIVRNTMPQLRDTTLSSWNYWFKDGQAGAWRASEYKFILRFDDVECEVLFRPLDTPDDVARVLSLEVTFAILDEFVQIRKEIVEALAARCGRYPPKMHGGATNWGMWGSSNTGDEDSWWYEYLVKNPLPKNAQLFIQPSGFSADAENVENLPGQTEYYSSQAEGKSREWIKQFIDVQWGFSLDGQPVFPAFRRDLHVATAPLLPNPHLPLVIALDPGLNYSAIAIMQEDMHGRLLVYDELIQRDMGAERQISERLKPLLKKKYSMFDNPIVAADPAAANRAQSDEKSVVDVYKRHFTVKYDTNNTLQPRLSAVEHYLMRLTDKGPALLIDPGCRMIIRGFEGGYRYAHNRKGVAAVEPDKNEYSHPLDAVQYGAKYLRNGALKEERRATSGNFAPPRFTNRYNFR